MKNKSVIMKILIVGSFLLILLLLIVVFSLIKIFVPKKEKVVEKTVISNNYELNDIKNINFNFVKSNSIFKISNNENLEIVQNSKETKFYLNYRVKDNQIFFEEDSYLINPQKKKYTIYIPEKYSNAITIVNGFGKVKINGLKNDLNINNNSGNISLNDIGNTIIKDVSGKLDFKDVIGDIEASSSTGDINIKNITGKVKIDTITGDITINNFEINGDSYFENVSGDIVIKINDNAACKINYYNETGKTKIDDKKCISENNIMDIKNVTGMIKIY